ncbi:MAG: TRAP transporter small permease subunit [Pseudomonadota bacterium]
MAEWIDRISRATGRVAAWLTLALVLVTVTVVVMRYAFDAGYIWMQELVVWLHAVVFMLGAAYTLLHDEHVRVDVFYREMTPRRRALVDLAGTLLLLLPLAAFIFIYSWEYVAGSWQIREGSRQARGLPFPAMSLMKSLLLAMPVLIALQGIAIALRAVAVLRGGAAETATHDDRQGL